jgi:hypothetical protein
VSFLLASSGGIVVSASASFLLASSGGIVVSAIGSLLLLNGIVHAWRDCGQGKPHQVAKSLPVWGASSMPTAASTRDGRSTLATDRRIARESERLDVNAVRQLLGSKPRQRQRLLRNAIIGRDHRGGPQHRPHRVALFGRAMHADLSRRHCEELLRRRNPVFLAALDCFAQRDAHSRDPVARNDQLNRLDRYSKPDG